MAGGLRTVRLWQAFRSWAKSQSLTNPDGIRLMIRLATSLPDPVPLSGAGSGSDRMAAS